jgi:hypothetical protein
MEKTGNSGLDSLVTESFAVAGTLAPLLLDGPWQVEFPEAWGASSMATFPKLEFWHAPQDEGIRFFPASPPTGRPSKFQKLLASPERIFPELGELAEIVEVTLNDNRWVTSGCLLTGSK